MQVLAAIATPFREDGQVDLDAFAAHAAWLAEMGLDGAFVAGTTGEGVLLEDDEVEALAARAAAAADGLRVIVQVGRPSTRATVRLARRALEAGADGVAAYVPWFYPVTPEQARAHFLALLDAADGAPAFLYNIPPRTVNDLSPALAAELAGAGFAGMKDSTGDLQRHRAYLAAAPDGFEIYVGSEPLVLDSARGGSAGTINGLANCRPELLTGLRDALAVGDAAAAERLQEELSALKAQVKSEDSTPAAVKRRVRERLAERGVDYPAGTRAPFA